MPPQIKHDLNRSGWESTDMPSVCERCLPENPYVQMIKEDYGAECKICTRPYTVFRWKADRTSRQKRTIICLTCARLKNCCQHCMLDLSFGLPITIRDAALKMVAPGPTSSINREYYAQEHESEIEEGRGAIEAYEKTDEKAMDLLKKLARSEPYSKRRRIEGGEDGGGGDGLKALPAPEKVGGLDRPGPIRTRDMRGGSRGGHGGGGRDGRPQRPVVHKPPTEEDWLPPADRNIKSLFVVGVEDDLPEYKLRDFFGALGKLQSLVCSHRAHCAYVNYATRKDAEAAADNLKGKAVVNGCPLRVTWGKPKQLDTLDRDQRIANARAGRSVVPRAAKGGIATAGAIEEGSSGAKGDKDGDSMLPLAPPGEDEVNYKSLAGD